MINRIKKMIFPDVCPVCNELVDGTTLCQNCEGELELVGDRGCRVCGKILKSERDSICSKCRVHSFCFEKNISVFAYEGRMKELIYRFKYNNVRVYSDYVAKVTAREYRRELARLKIDAIVPVPMYKKKKRTRGYNQAEEFARSLSKYIGIPCDLTSMIRVRETKPMKDLSDIQRFENLKGAFGVNPDIVAGYDSVLLVDDIFTSGSTLDACARVLKKAGVKKVYGLCIATGRD